MLRDLGHTLNFTLRKHIIPLQTNSETTSFTSVFPTGFSVVILSSLYWTRTSEQLHSWSKKGIHLWCFGCGKKSNIAHAHAAYLAATFFPTIKHYSR